MNVFQYVAHNEPEAARSICSKYGYRLKNVQTKSDLGECLRQVVAYEGEGAMKVVLNIHPDKDVILEQFGQREVFAGMDGSGADMKRQNSGCNCGGCSGCGKKAAYLNADGGTAGQQSNNTTALVGIALLAGTIFIAAAIITKK